MSIRSILENSRRFLCGNIRTEQNRYYFRMYTKYIVTIQYIYTFVTFGICYTAIIRMLVLEIMIVYVYFFKGNNKTHAHAHTRARTHARTRKRATHTNAHIFDTGIHV